LPWFPSNYHLLRYSDLSLLPMPCLYFSKPVQPWSGPTDAAMERSRLPLSLPTA